MRVSIICVGNEYQRDDGFGPAVARYLLEQCELPRGVEVLDRAVMGYAMVEDLKRCDVAVAVDALDGTGAEPGEVLAFDPEDMATSGQMASLHDVRFADVLAASRFMGGGCGIARCFGVQVADRGDGTLDRGLSAPVAAAVEPCARAVLDYVTKLLHA